MAKVKPPAELVARPGDEELTIEQLEKTSLFAQLKEQPDLGEFPGTVILRHYRPGDIVCRLGEPGWTAFYILTGKDLGELRGHAVQPAEVLPRVATVHLGARRPSGLWDRLKSLSLPLFGRAPETPERQLATLYEGELFGEMSCLYRTPRSATIVVDRECHMLEMLRNILDKMLSNRNRAFKDQIDAVYRKRALELQLRALPMFLDLPVELLHTLRDRAELRDLEPGELICDEFERSDSMYIVRSGFVKVMKHVSFLLSAEAVADWPAFCAGLQTAEQETAGPKRKVWDLLPETPARTAVRKAGSGGDLTADEQQQIIHALNDLLKQPKLYAAAEFKEILQATGLVEEVKKLPSGVKKWAQLQPVCDFNRRLLQAVFPDVLPRRLWTEHDARVLSYRSQGDFIGEMGLVTGKPRSATCIAYDHPGSKFGRVELVRISKELFADMLATSPTLNARVTDLVRERVEHTRERLAKPAWQKFDPAALTERFDELGLVQGQKLMLIDLDRCTRCDECVRACVATHTDGRSRLFLDGPRFTDLVNGQLKNYLVPATCRQCKDPVCLIGCPVGSIHKGDNGQVVIEDWCIGCSRCAEQCPYGAIQMHAVGLIPRRSRGWRIRRSPETAAAGTWCAAEFADNDWLAGQTPFLWDRDLRDRLASDGEIQFRFVFVVPAGALQGTNTFQLQVLSLSPAVSVWVNGVAVFSQVNGQKTPMKPKEKGEVWNLEATLGPEIQAGEGKAGLRAGTNVIAVSAAPTANRTDVLLEVGLYQLSKPVVPIGMTGDLTQEQVMNTAVVCDMCSEQFGQRPACVNACPHDAALRVSARAMFPERGTAGTRS